MLQTIAVLSLEFEELELKFHLGLENVLFNDSFKRGIIVETCRTPDLRGLRMNGTREQGKLALKYKWF